MDEIKFQRLSQEIDRRVMPAQSPTETVSSDLMDKLMNRSLQRNARALSLLEDL